MKKTTWMLVIAGSFPGAAFAQEADSCTPARDGSGEIVLRGGVALDENGDFCGSLRMQANGLVRVSGNRWIAPTPDEALRQLRLPVVPGEFSPSAPARAVLTQRFDARPRADLDAFADELVRIALSEGIPRVSVLEKSSAVQKALSALFLSANPSQGVPYEGAFDALLRIWEASYGDAPPGQRYDPMGALGRLYRLQPEGRGGDLLLAELAATRPPKPMEGRNSTPWCVLVRPLFYLPQVPAEVGRQGPDVIDAWRLRHLTPKLRDLPGDASLHASICGTGDIHSRNWFGQTQIGGLEDSTFRAPRR